MPLSHAIPTQHVLIQPRMLMKQQQNCAHATMGILEMEHQATVRVSSNLKEESNQN